MIDRKPPAKIIPIRPVEHGSTLPPSGPANQGPVPQPIAIVDARRERRRGPRYNSILPMTVKRFEFAMKRKLDKLAEEFDLDAESCDSLAVTYINRRRMNRVGRAA